MGKIYFVRHAKPDYTNHDDELRPLTEEGIESSKRVMEFLKDKNITKAYCSPYKRSIDTISRLTEELNLEIKIIDDLRERKISNEWLDDYENFSRNQWDNFEYKLPNGECLKEVQERNIAALNKILEESIEENIVIGTHGTALSTIINYYKKDFDYKEFMRVVKIMPWIVCAEIKGDKLVSIEEFILEE